MRRTVGKIKLSLYSFFFARRKGAILSLGALTLAGCASSPEVTLGPGADSRAGGRVLLSAAGDGPVPMLVDRIPSTGDAAITADELAGWAAEGVQDWTRTSFTPSTTAASGTRLVLRFTEVAAFSPNDACREPGGGPVGQEHRPPTLWAYLCEDDKAVSSTSGTATGDDSQAVHRLVVAVTERLVPGAGTNRGGLYPGVGMFGGVGIGAGSGGWRGGGGGVGIGLGF